MSIKHKETQWQIKGVKEPVRESQLINYIRGGHLNLETLIRNQYVREWVSLEETVYRFYFEEGNEEDEII